MVFGIYLCRVVGKSSSKFCSPEIYTIVKTVLKNYKITNTKNTIKRDRILNGSWTSLNFTCVTVNLPLAIERGLEIPPKADICGLFTIVRYWFVYFLLLFSCSVVSNSLQPNELQHARFPYPSLAPGGCSNSCTLSQ